MLPPANRLGEVPAAVQACIAEVARTCRATSGDEGMRAQHSREALSRVRMLATLSAEELRKSGVKRDRIAAFGAHSSGLAALRQQRVKTEASGANTADDDRVDHPGGNPQKWKHRGYVEKKYFTVIEPDEALMVKDLHQNLDSMWKEQVRACVLAFLVEQLRLRPSRPARASRPSHPSHACLESAAPHPRSPPPPPPPPPHPTPLD